MYHCAKRLFPPWMLQIGLSVRPESNYFLGVGNGGVDRALAVLKLKVGISVFEKRGRKLGLAFCRSLFRDPVLELESDLFRNSEINVLT